MQLTIKNTIFFSLLVQIITGIISLHGLFITLPKKHQILSDVLILETIVQFIEMIFYIWISYAVININNITSRRYIDWFITTPTMLLSTIMFMKYQELKEQHKLNDQLSTYQFIKDNKVLISKIFLFNLLMLLFGYLGEKTILSKITSTTIGFVFFYKSFYLIYNNYAKKSILGLQLFYFLFVVWSLYGVAALLSIKLKNISYNLLDIVAKNFYGLYIYYKILQLSNHTYQ